MFLDLVLAQVMIGTKYSFVKYVKLMAQFNLKQLSYIFLFCAELNVF